MDCGGELTVQMAAISRSDELRRLAYATSQPDKPRHQGQHFGLENVAKRP
ncbi:MAG: hypothetical protein ACRCVV_04630 [Shewanella sp.]